jgi:ankyrin repeat protein
MITPARDSFFGNISRQRNRYFSGDDSRGKTALHEAAIHGYVRMVEPLLEEGVSVHETVMNHASMFHGQTAIDIAAFYGEVEMVRKLHECGGLLGRKRGGKTTLYYAVSTSRYDLVKLLEYWSLERASMRCLRLMDWKV